MQPYEVEVVDDLRGLLNEEVLRQPFLRRCLPAALCISLIVSGCGEVEDSNSNVVAASTTTKPPEYLNPISPLNVVLPGVILYEISTPVSANSQADRINPPKELDCAETDVDLIIAGNSTDSDFQRDPSRVWPTLLVENLNDSPFLNGLEVLNMAVPGSTITRPNPWNPRGDEPHWRLITHVDTIIASVPPEQRKSKIVGIHPSFIDLQDGAVNDEYAIQRAVDGVVLSRQKLVDAGFTVIIFGMRPVTREADNLHVAFAGFSLQHRIDGTNALLKEAGLLPDNYIPPLLGNDGYANSFYFEEDGLHQTDGGNVEIAALVGQDWRILQALSNLCAN